jgi:hypothetical protein
LFFAFALNGQPQSEDKPTLSKEPLTAEQLQVYATFLDGHLQDAKSQLNLADKTYPLRFREMDENGDCLNHLPLENLTEAGHTIHSFDPEIAKGRKLVLVDTEKHKVKDPGDSIKNGESVADAVSEGFASGYLSLSEIVFDKDHKHAAFKHGFHCGMLCGHGGTVLFEKTAHGWKEIKHSCSIWIS